MATNYKIMPHSVEAEQSVLCSMLINNDCISNITQNLKKSDFYLTSHAEIYEVIYNLFSGNIPVDFVTVTDKLDTLNLLEKVGGIDYISTLTNLLVSAANFSSYVDIVKNHALNRNLINAAQKIIENAYNGEDAVNNLASAEKIVYDIAEKNETSSLEHIGNSLNDAIMYMDMLAKNGGVTQGIATGISEFDAITNGLQNSDLIILAARPGVGKSSFAMNVAINAALTQNKSVAIFNLEMSKMQLSQRSLGQVAKVSLSKAKKSQLNQEDWKSIWSANKKLSDSKIYIDDTPTITPMDILDKCRRLKREKGLDLIVVDYLQLMTNGGSDGKKEESRQQTVSDISRRLKLAAKELNVPVIVLSQLNRTIEQRKDHYPMLSDLRESGSIEQDADIILFIHNPEKYADLTEPVEPGICELVIAKHRSGEVGSIKMRWIGELTTFVDIDKKVKLNNSETVKVVPNEAFGGVPEQVESLDNVDMSELDSVFDDE